jgi:hypothetical protein
MPTVPSISRSDFRRLLGGGGVDIPAQPSLPLVGSSQDPSVAAIGATAKAAQVGFDVAMALVQAENERKANTALADITTAANNLRIEMQRDEAELETVPDRYVQQFDEMMLERLDGENSAVRRAVMGKRAAILEPRRVDLTISTRERILERGEQATARNSLALENAYANAPVGPIGEVELEQTDLELDGLYADNPYLLPEQRDEELFQSKRRRQFGRVQGIIAQALTAENVGILDAADEMLDNPQEHLPQLSVDEVLQLRSAVETAANRLTEGAGKANAARAEKAFDKHMEAILRGPPGAQETLIEDLIADFPVLRKGDQTVLLNLIQERYKDVIATDPWTWVGLQDAVEAGEPDALSRLANALAEERITFPQYDAMRRLNRELSIPQDTAFKRAYYAIKERFSIPLEPGLIAKLTPAIASAITERQQQAIEELLRFNARIPGPTDAEYITKRQEILAAFGAEDLIGLTLRDDQGRAVRVVRKPYGLEFRGIPEIGAADIETSYGALLEAFERGDLSEEQLISQESNLQLWERHFNGE